MTVGSEKGWGFFSPAPVRYSSPWGRLGGVIPFGEGAGVRLVVDGGEAVVSIDKAFLKPRPRLPSTYF